VARKAKRIASFDLRDAEGKLIQRLKLAYAARLDSGERDQQPAIIMTDGSRIALTDEQYAALRIAMRLPPLRAENDE
jgi:hypothetical protein